MRHRPPTQRALQEPCCTHRKTAEEVISLSSCGGSKSLKRESKKTMSSESSFQVRQSTSSSGQPQRQCRSGSQRRGPQRNSITRSKGAEPGAYASGPARTRCSRQSARTSALASRASMRSSSMKCCAAGSWSARTDIPSEQGALAGAQQQNSPPAGGASASKKKDTELSSCLLNDFLSAGSPGGDLVGCEDVLVRARPVGQQRARDGGLRLRVLRACCAIVFQQRLPRRGRPAALL